MAALENVSRRAVLLGLGAGALVLSLGLPSLAQEPEEPLKFGADAMPNGWRDDPRIFISIDPDGTVTVTVHRSEMGQGVRTSIAMAIADELEADWNRVRVAQAQADEPTFGNQDTDGSRSLRHFFEPMRRAGAAARLMLREAAAAEWSVPVEEVVAENHVLSHAASGKQAGYGDMAARAAEGEVPARETLVLKSPDRFRYITRHGDLAQVLGGIAAAATAGLRIKINTVALKGLNEDELGDLLAWCVEEGHDLALIETMPLGAIDEDRVDRFLSLSDVRERLATRYTLTPLPDRTGGPARYVRVEELGIRLGLITPMTENFCAGCNRIRLTV